MDNSKIFIKRFENFTITAVEGNAIELSNGISLYKKKGIYRLEADFSPILNGRSSVEDFLAANLYGDQFCTMTALQNPNNDPNTSMVSIGTTELPLEFLVDLANHFNMVPIDPSSQLKNEANLSSMPLMALYNATLSKFKDSNIASRILSESLRLMQEGYRQEAKIRGSEYN